MGRYLHKIIMYMCMFCMGIVHLAPYETVWVIILYYFSTYGLIVGLLNSINAKLNLNKYDKIENKLLMFYFVCKMIYHISNHNSTWLEYLYSLHSEFWAGIFTFLVLVLMFGCQIINVIKHVPKR